MRLLGVRCGRLKVSKDMPLGSSSNRSWTQSLSQRANKYLEHFPLSRVPLTCPNWFDCREKTAMQKHEVVSWGCRGNTALNASSSKARNSGSRNRVFENGI